MPLQKIFSEVPDFRKSRGRQLDVVFLEDRQRVQMSNAADNMATLRKMVQQLLPKAKGTHSVKTARKKVAWNNEFLLSAIDYIQHI